MSRNNLNLPGHDARGDSHRGYSLIELLITLAVSITLLIAVGNLVVGSQGAMNDMMGVAAMNEVGQRAMDRTIWELRFASPTTVKLSQPTNAPSVTFQKVTGWSGEAATLSATQTLSFSGGRLTLNGIVIAGGITSFTLNQSGATYTIAIQIDRTVWSGGTSRAFTKTFTSQLTL